jgi:LysM repeat protein
MAANHSGTTQVGHAVFGEDAQGTTDEGTVQSTSKFFERLGTASTPTQVIEADLSSWLSNGIRLNFTTVNGAAEKLTCLLVGGSDVEAKVLHGNFPGTGSNDLVLAHGLSGTPSMLIVLGDASTPTWMPLGFYDGTNTAGINYTSTNAAATTAVQEILSSTLVVPAYNTIADAYTVQALDGTNVTLRDTGNATGGRGATVLAIRGLTAKAGFFTTDTSTGSTNKITSLSVAPQAAIFIGTRMTSVGTSTSDLAGAFNLGFAANRSGTTIQQGSASLSEQDNVTPTVNKNQTSSTEALRILDTAGAADYEGAVNAFNSTSIGINTTNAAASALEVAYIAFGATLTAPSLSSVSVTAHDQTSYTVGYTSSQATTVYLIARNASLSPASCAQIQAGNDSTGSLALGATDKDVNGADSSVLTVPSTPRRPIHSIDLCATDAGGTSAVTTISNSPLTPPTGFQDITIASIGTGSPCESFNAATSPDIVATDILRAPTTTSPGSFALSIGTDCQFGYSGDGSRQLALNIGVYDASVGSYHADDIDFVSNDLPPNAPPPGSIRFFVPVGSAMTPIDLSTYCDDPEGDTITVTGINLPPGLSIASSILQGTGTSAGKYTTPLFTCVDQFGATSSGW